MSQQRCFPLKCSYLAAGQVRLELFIALHFVDEGLNLGKFGCCVVIEVLLDIGGLVIHDDVG